MKKITGFILATLCFTTSMTSCMNDSGAEAKCTYYVVTDSIIYTDSLDAPYDSLIRACLMSLERSNYLFQESAKVDESLQEYAIAKCNEQAIQEFKTDIAQSLTLATVQNEMHKANSDYFTMQGIPNASAINLHPFTVHVSLWNYSFTGYLVSDKINVLP